MTATIEPPLTQPVARDALKALLAPRSIAVIGASRTPRTMGNQVLANLLRQGFTGTVYPVNPRARSVCSVLSYPSIAEVPEQVDLAVIAVPKDNVLRVASECAIAGVQGLVVISAGFKEQGSQGASREERLLELVRRNHMRMVGPNCMGIINASPDVMMNATFAPVMPPFGDAAFVSQSGALGLSVLDYAREYEIGISQFVSVGNKADVSGNDLLEAWEHDEAVKVILMYVENFGNPTRFLEIASRITASKPIITVKAGRTKAGARAALSHTGALAASDDAVDALLTQAGVLRAGTIEELFDMAMAFGVRSLPRSRRTAVVSNAGGPGILAADAMEACGLELVLPSPMSVTAIERLLPPDAPARNPLDLIASATPEAYRSAIATLLGDPAIDCVVPIFIPPLGIDQEAVARAIVDAASTQPAKPVLAVLMGRQGLSEWRAELRAAGIPTYIFPESAARAIAALNRHREMAERERTPITPLEVDRASARLIIDTARHDARTRLTEPQALALLQAYGIPVAPARLAATRAEARAAASAIGFPVVMKVVSPDVSHKSDAGGVVLDIADERAAADAYDQIIRDVGFRAAGARIEGVLVAKQIEGGRETIVGFTRDPKFGPLVMFGLGGIYAEALHDVVFRIAPIGDSDVRAMVSGIRGAAILEGIRGQPPVDLSLLCEVVRRIGQLAMDCPEIAELDVNPVLAFESAVVAVDCRAVLSAPMEPARLSQSAKPRGDSGLH
jgi:acetyl coenzyme A synthetase (ADP forming)-like protein